jgi:phosphinothricin acetyltransferase
MATIITRTAVEDDVPRLTEIYNHYVRHTAVTFDLEEWTVDRRLKWFEQFAPIGRHQLIVAEENGTALGYAGTTRFRVKAAYDPTVETTIYCAHEAVGRGLGAILYRALFEALAQEDVHRLVAGYTLPNAGSEKLHQQFGFKPVGIFTDVGRKLGKYWDVMWMERPLKI